MFHVSFGRPDQEVLDGDEDVLLREWWLLWSDACRALFLEPEDWRERDVEPRR